MYDTLDKLGGNMNIDNKDFEKISSTAIVTSYPRTFTDIPYEKEIYEWLNKHCNEKVTLNKMLAPEIEARYKLISKLLNDSKVIQVLELASGYSSRGLIYSDKGYNYVEMDLENVCDNKIIIIKSITRDIPKSLKIISGNALNKEDFLNNIDVFEYVSKDSNLGGNTEFFVPWVRVEGFFFYL